MADLPARLTEAPREFEKAIIIECADYFDLLLSSADSVLPGAWKRFEAGSQHQSNIRQRFRDVGRWVTVAVDLDSSDKG